MQPKNECRNTKLQNLKKSLLWTIQVVLNSLFESVQLCVRRKAENMLLVVKLAYDQKHDRFFDNLFPTLTK